MKKHSTVEAMVDEEDFDSDNSSDESMSDEDCDIKWLISILPRLYITNYGFIYAYIWIVPFDCSCTFMFIVIYIC